jgi:intracellular septation protein A
MLARVTDCQVVGASTVHSVLRLAFARVRPLLWAALPAVTVATFIPLGLFYLALGLTSLPVAIGVSVVYAYSAAAYQWARSGRISGMLLITVFMVTVRAAAAAASGQTMVYFAVPVVETVGFGLLFSVSLLTREALIVRLARDVLPGLADDLAARRGLVRSLSLVWTVTYVGSGATTLTLLATQPLTVYLGAHQLAGWCWTGSGIAVSVALCRWRARNLLSVAMRGNFAAPVPIAA